MLHVRLCYAALSVANHPTQQSFKTIAERTLDVVSKPKRISHDLAGRA